MTGPPAPWTAERPVDIALATRLIRSQFPELARAEVAPFAQGWDHTVYLVGGDWVFRFPRREIVLPGVAREVALLPLLAPLLPLPVPVPEFIGVPAESYPWPFWGARLVPGVELAATEHGDGRLRAAARQVGGFLRVLHDLEVEAVAPRDLPIDPLRRTDARSLAGRVEERLLRLGARGVWSPTMRSQSVLDDARQLGVVGGAERFRGNAAGPGRGLAVASGAGRFRGNAASQVLVHGDLHLRHLLVGPDGGAAGVIDWGDACLADPAVDLSLAYGGFAGADRAAFLDAYGSVTAEQEVCARVLALHLCSALAEAGLATGDQLAVRTAVAGLARATAD